MPHGSLRPVSGGGDKGMQMWQLHEGDRLREGVPLQQEVHADALVRQTPVQSKVLRLHAEEHIKSLREDMREHAQLPQAQVRDAVPQRSLLSVYENGRYTVSLRQQQDNGAMRHQEEDQATTLQQVLQSSAYMPSSQEGNPQVPPGSLSTVQEGLRHDVQEMWSHLSGHLSHKGVGKGQGKWDEGTAGWAMGETEGHHGAEDLTVPTVRSLRARDLPRCSRDASLAVSHVETDLVR